MSEADLQHTKATDLTYITMTISVAIIGGTIKKCCLSEEARNWILKALVITPLIGNYKSN